jgi:hypothetical protein
MGSVVRPRRQKKLGSNCGETLSAKGKTMNTDPKSHPNAELVELLRRTLDLLGGPKKDGANLAKVEEAHSFTASGIGCEAWDELAARWSITGALARFSMKPLSWSDLPRPEPGEGYRNDPPIKTMRSEFLFDAAFRYVFGAAILQAPQTVNGVNNRGWDAVRDVIQLAILLAENEAAVLPAMMLPPGKTPSPRLREYLERILQAQGADNQVPS